MAASGEGTAGGERATERAIVYCLIPPELAPTLHPLLRDHFAGDPGVEVVVERRRSERRGERERRLPDPDPAEAGERRRIHSPSGRRVGERRATVMEVDNGPPLPAAAEPHADRLRFVERLEPSTEHLENRDTARLVTRFQAGDVEAFTTVYIRYFDRVYTYLHMLLGDAEVAEQATHEVFVRVLEDLPDHERGRQPFRAWLFAVVRSAAMSRLESAQRVGAEDPLPGGSELERAAHEDEELFALHWITDRDLLVLVERLPPSQRQVLLMRYMLDLPSSEVAEIIGVSRPAVRTLQESALGMLRERLETADASDGESELPANNQG